MNNRLKYSALAVLVLSMLFSCCSVKKHTAVAVVQSDDAMYKAVETLLYNYPEASLCDIYKSCFQDYFGPAHMIPDCASARSYIQQELAQATTLQGAYYEACGWRGNYYRVNLSVISDSLVSLDKLADAFCNSAPDVTPVVGDEWIAEWEQIMSAVRRVVSDNAHRIPRMTPIITQFASDSAHIATMMSEGKYVLHHSKIYELNYHPHYRIIDKDIFREEILPLIEGSNK